MQTISDIAPGQRWISETEPELGFGIMLKVEFKRVELVFPAVSEQRVYALDSAPLRRVILKPGEELETHDGDTLEIDDVIEREKLLIYVCGEREIEEAQLADTMSFSRPEDRLLAGRVDDLHTYDLRVDALQRQCEVMKSPVRGFVGGRVDLIPHQMSIAGEVSSRLAPRVLLADEVGLGKTIEACLIMHRLHLTGRADRVLILVPEPLLHQWFVELLRRFNLLFSLFDEERCQSLEGEGENPFLDSQLVLCSVNFLADNPNRSQQVIEAGWDMLIVDEAHHLEWSEQEASPAYQMVDSLARRTESLLLLTATPRQLGAEGHFARLRLLDPERYVDLQKFQEEAEQYEAVAEAVGRLQAGEPLSAEDRALFTAQSERVHDHCLALDGGDESAREPLIRELLDAFGTGRVMFRNTRTALQGFPERKVNLVEIEQDHMQWLVGLLQSLGEEKVLLICRTRELAEEISERLQEIINIKCGHFHEGMTLLQRDRSAAYFAEPDGARILICSEIGSEGRNFQFAHHLVLFDLPEDPELLEQRIGRLDRIGQSETINIHVPYEKGTRGEFLARWYHEGLDAFEHSLHGATEILKELGGVPESCDDLDAFIATSKLAREKVSQQLQRGYDRLLELNSSRPGKAAEAIDQISSMDDSQISESFLLRLWDHFGLHVEELVDRSYLLLPGHLITDAFPALPDDGLNVTFDRTRALSREDCAFMSWDHPVARTALDLLLTSEAGNASFGVWEGAPHKGILVETYAVVECVAPAKLHSDRFLPVTPIRVQVDHSGADRSDDARVDGKTLRVGNLHKLLDQEKFRRKMLPMMLGKSRDIATLKMKDIVAAAVAESDAKLGVEIDRLVALGEINDHVSEEEIAALRVQRDALHQAISKSRLRLDSVRIIFCQP
ncbi:DEAD/DEAH box helicase family protein [Verrucomicrobiaceae bacterium 5K15]|uniref:DEAD/DEAH box helicase family protein n=1 Tax=Oceaniferula flava TaxID=2800421 RepID=A0AAE2S9B8_9BACT|nr:SNF2-related protein [Oceaniferula flavus]MBK1853388.1 DEAD/DEAH box helicase family protein [Oceaniferula flavus]MBM1134693.1 DEAD/DEAH box helicase family protein [Oceaniferula flavus]